MRSVCEENYRLGNLSGSDNTRRYGPLRLRNGRMKTRQRCSCNLEPKTSNSELTPTHNWNFRFETESFSHHRTCPFFAPPARTTVVEARMGGCGALLAGAIEVSISITRGAGGLSISPSLRCARVVSHDSPAFVLVRQNRRTDSSKWWQCIDSISELDALLDVITHKLELLFRTGKASPCDVDLAGNTIHHVRVTLFSTSSH